MARFTKIMATAFTSVILTTALSGQVASIAAEPTAKASNAKTEVQKIYKNQYAPALNISNGWTGSVNSCRAGNFSLKAVNAMEKQINAVRKIAGLSTVKVARSKALQKTALIMEANQNLSHQPPKAWKCWSQAGAQGAGRSNLALHYSNKAGNAVDQYMDDYGSGNTAVGHRRWLLAPTTSKFLVGQTANANAWQAFNLPQNARAKNPTWVSWPAKGYFPSQLEPQGRWSLSSKFDGLKWKNARVTIVKNGKTYQPKTYNAVYGYGKPTLVWDMPAAAGKQGVYKVTVRGAIMPGGKKPVVRYVTRIFNAS